MGQNIYLHLFYKSSENVIFCLMYLDLFSPVFMFLVCLKGRKFKATFAQFDKA